MPMRGVFFLLLIGLNACWAFRHTQDVAALSALDAESISAESNSDRVGFNSAERDTHLTAVKTLTDYIHTLSVGQALDSRSRRATSSDDGAGAASRLLTAHLIMNRERLQRTVSIVTHCLRLELFHISSTALYVALHGMAFDDVVLNLRRLYCGGTAVDSAEDREALSPISPMIRDALLAFIRGYELRHPWFFLIVPLADMTMLLHECMNQLVQNGKKGVPVIKQLDDGLKLNKLVLQIIFSVGVLNTEQTAQQLNRFLESVARFVEEIHAMVPADTALNPDAFGPPESPFAPLRPTSWSEMLRDFKKFIGEIRGYYTEKVVQDLLSDLMARQAFSLKHIVATVQASLRSAKRVFVETERIFQDILDVAYRLNCRSESLESASKSVNRLRHLISSKAPPRLRLRQALVMVPQFVKALDICGLIQLGLLEPLPEPAKPRKSFWTDLASLYEPTTP